MPHPIRPIIDGEAHCKQCDQWLTLDKFGRDNCAKTGVRACCKACAFTKAKAWRAANLELAKARDAESYARQRAANPERARERANKNSRLFRSRNRERALELNRLSRERNPEADRESKRKYKKNNLHKGRADAQKRNTIKLKAMPKWLSDDHKAFMEVTYAMAVEMERRCEIKFHVDHIHPLQGETVCGLHVPWNLRVITATENIRKGNRLVA
jgi:hypothetical protein